MSSSASSPRSTASTVAASPPDERAAAPLDDWMWMLASTRRSSRISLTGAESSIA